MSANTKHPLGPANSPAARGRLRTQRGAALVEGALILFPFILVILGAVDLGQFLMNSQYLSHRARATARWAAVHSYNPSDTSNIQNYAVYNQATPPRNGNDRPGLFGLRPSNVSVTHQGTVNSSDYRLEVTIAAPMQLFSPYLSQNLTLRAKATIAAESLGAAQ